MYEIGPWNKLLRGSTVNSSYWFFSCSALFSGDRFPAQPASFKPAVLELIVDSRRLCFLLLRLLGLALGLRDVEFFVKNHDLNSTANTSMMRTLYYPKIAKEDMKEGKVHMSEHFCQQVSQVRWA